MSFWTNALVTGQSMWLRSAALFLPPASGPNHGVVDAPGSPAFRLAVVGDSPAAGIGVATHAQGIGGCLARELATTLERRVEWCVHGLATASVQRIRLRLIPRIPVDQDLVVLVAGISDALADTAMDDWSIDIAAAIEDLAVRHRRVLVVGAPPFAQFPCLPSPLSEVLEQRAIAMDEITSAVCEGRPGVTFASSRPMPSETDGLFAVDGFHPSGPAYASWAHRMAAALS